MVTEQDLEVATAIYPVLVKIARERRTVTYEELIHEAQNRWPDVDAIQNSIPVGIGRRLDVVKMFLKEQGLPDLTSLVLSKATGEVGSGFGANPVLAREQVFAFDWTSVSDEFGLHVEALRRKIERPARNRPVRTRAEALDLVAGHFRSNKTRYPEGIVKERERLIELVMFGASVADAFQGVASDLLDSEAGTGR